MIRQEFIADVADASQSAPPEKCCQGAFVLLHLFSKDE